MASEAWLDLPGGRCASSLGKARGTPSWASTPRSLRMDGAVPPVRGFVILGPLANPKRLRPTVAHGVVHGDGAIELRFGLLSTTDLEALRTFWGL